MAQLHIQVVTLLIFVWPAGGLRASIASFSYVPHNIGAPGSQHLGRSGNSSTASSEWSQGSSSSSSTSNLSDWEEDDHVSGDESAVPDQTPVGIVVDQETLNQFLDVVGVLGTGSQAQVLDGFVGDAVDMQMLSIESLQKLQAQANSLIATKNPEAFSAQQRSCAHLLQFIENELPGVYSFNIERKHVEEVLPIIEGQLESARDRLEESRSTATADDFDRLMMSLEAESNPYAPDFRALKGQHVALKMSTADDDDVDMLFKEAVFGEVLRASGGYGWKVGGYKGFVCVRHPEPVSNKSEKKHLRSCFSHFCPYGTLALIISDAFPGKNLYESKAHFGDHEEAEDFTTKLLAAVSLMHGLGVEHGDLAARNIMFSKPDLAVIDLGYAYFRSGEAQHLGMSSLESHEPPLFQTAIKSGQCAGFLHQRQGRQDAAYLAEWLPDMVSPHLTMGEITSKLEPIASGP